jgi:hypothetical protein
MPEEHSAPVSPILLGVAVNPGPGILVAPEARTTVGDPASAPVPPVSREAERAEQVELFRTELRAHGLGGDWHLFSPGEMAAFIGLAKSFDLTILGQLSPEIRSTGFSPGRNRHCDGSAGSGGPVCRHFRYGRQARARRLGRDARGGARGKRCAAAPWTGRGGDRDVRRSARGDRS